MTVISVTPEATFWRTTAPPIDVPVPAAFVRTGWNRIYVLIPLFVVPIILFVVAKFNGSRVTPNFDVYDHVNALQGLILFLVSLIFLAIALRLLTFAIAGVANMRADFFEGGARISVDDDGLLDLRISKHRIRWQDVRAAKVNSYRDRREVVLMLKDGAEIEIRRMRIDMLAFNLLFGRRRGRRVLVDVNTFDTDSHTIATVIDTLARNHAPHPKR